MSEIFEGVAPAELEIEVNGDQSVLRLEADSYRVGRAATNEISFPGVLGLSREHLILERGGTQWLARDLGSKTGSLVNGERFRAAYFTLRGPDHGRLREPGVS